MSDPQRLTDAGGESTAQERELIEAARAHGMPTAAKAAIWSAVVAQGVGAVASAQAAATASAVVKGGALAGLWSWKGILVFAAVGAAAVTGARLHPSHRAQPGQQGPAVSPAVVSPAESVGSREPAMAEPPVAPPAVSASPRPVERVRPSRARAAGPAPMLPASRLAQEAQSLVEARKLLRAGEIGAAQAIIEQANRDFAGGRLGQEREVLMIESLARSGQRELARRRAGVFLRDYPSSPHAADVRSYGEGN